MDRCGVCNGDGSTCSTAGSTQTITTNTTSAKKEVTPGSGNLITSALNWLKKLGYDVDRRGHIATPENALQKGPSSDGDVFYWATVRSGCSVSCGGGEIKVTVSPVSWNQCLLLFDWCAIVSHRATSSVPIDQLICMLTGMNWNTFLYQFCLIHLLTILDVIMSYALVLRSSISPIRGLGRNCPSSFFWNIYDKTDFIPKRLHCNIENQTNGLVSLHLSSSGLLDEKSGWRILNEHCNCALAQPWCFTCLRLA